MKQLSNEEAEKNSNEDNGSMDVPGNKHGSVNTDESEDKKQFQDYKFKIVPPGQRPANYDETAE